MYRAGPRPPGTFLGTDLVLLGNTVLQEADCGLESRERLVVSGCHVGIGSPPVPLAFGVN